jgi:RecA-family ATPase
MNKHLKTNPFLKAMDIRCTLSKPPPEMDHVLPGLLAGTVGMLAGPGGIGKTMFELQVALAVACGGRVCGGLFEGGNCETLTSKKEPGKVVLVVAEETVDVIAHRLHAIASTLLGPSNSLGLSLSPQKVLDLWEKNLHIYPLAGGARVSLMSKDFDATDSFYDLAAVCAGARLVILDPIRRLHLCDENDSGAMTALVQLLQEMVFESQGAVVFAHHTNRASTQLGQGDLAGAARGSTALSDGVRWQLNMSAPTKDSARLHGIKPEEHRMFVMVDMPKTSHLAPQLTAVLKRHAGGVLMLAGGTENAPEIEVKRGVSGSRLTSRSKAVRT